MHITAKRSQTANKLQTQVIPVDPYILMALTLLKGTKTRIY